jgi:hypothetical protein
MNYKKTKSINLTAQHYSDVVAEVNKIAASKDMNVHAVARRMLLIAARAFWRRKKGSHEA